MNRMLKLRDSGSTSHCIKHTCILHPEAGAGQVQQLKDNGYTETELCHMILHRAVTVMSAQEAQISAREHADVRGSQERGQATLAEPSKTNK
jgi:hypothetical protein